MKTQLEDVESFLKEFKAAMKAAGVIVIERQENLQGMFDLEVNPTIREKILKSLNGSDYYRGPSMQTGWIGEAWEFGKTVNSKEAYIKVSMGVVKSATRAGVGVPAKSVICISFHLAKEQITYPFKN